MGGELNVKDISNKYWEKGIGTGIDFWLVKGIGIDFPVKTNWNWNILKGMDPITGLGPFPIFLDSA